MTGFTGVFGDVQENRHHRPALPDRPARGHQQPPPVPLVFAFGVASGDPLTDRVMLWTHARIPASAADVSLNWHVASAAAFASIVRSGSLLATEASSFTAKVDVTGLMLGASYFYRFRDAAGVVFLESYFHAYDAAAKSEAPNAIHPGDCIYEYGSDPGKTATDTADPAYA